MRKTLSESSPFFSLRIPTLCHYSLLFLVSLFVLKTTETAQHWCIIIMTKFYIENHNAKSFCNNSNETENFYWIRKILWWHSAAWLQHITWDIWTCRGHFCRQTAGLIASVMYKAGPGCFTRSYRPNNDLLSCYGAHCVMLIPGYQPSYKELLWTGQCSVEPVAI